MAKDERRLYTFKLHKDEDADLIKFLDSVPKTFVIKTALRNYMNNPTLPGGTETTHTDADTAVAPQPEKEKASSELLGF